MRNRIYLVTGAAGNLGGNVCRQLLEKGERVRALVLRNDPTEKFLPKETEVVHGDLLDVSSLEEFFRTAEEDEVCVIHCAAIVWEKMEMNPKVRAVNVDGTANIIDQCLKHHVRKLVYVGTTGAIPELPAGQKIREGSRPLPADRRTGRLLFGYESRSHTTGTGCSKSASRTGCHDCPAFGNLRTE